VLQVGPLYINHLRRWAEHGVALGYRVWVAGHEKPGRRTIDFAPMAETVETYDPRADPIEWLADVIERVEPDIVHAHWLPRWGYVAVAAARRPVVVTAWGSDVYLATDENRARGDEAIQGADAVLARSAHMRDALMARGAAAERLHPVDLGIDLGRFRPATPEERSRARDELGLPGGPVILSPRAPTPLYNLDIVLAAFSRLRERVRDATLVFAHGDLPLPRELRDHPGVRAVGDVAHADMDRYVRAATAVVSIPSSDGSPNSVWEALACGVPVVASDLPQLRERIGDSGAALLVTPTPAAVAAALYELVTQQELHARMAASGRAWALAHVDERDALARLRAVYDAVRSRDRATAAAQPARPS
jgi:L-malate glycosyltransferase